MSRTHHRPRPLPPRRGSHGDADSCVVAWPPGGDDDTYFGFCEKLGLWRIKAPPFDAYGAIDPNSGIAGFYEALAAAVEELRPVRPAMAEAFERLLPD